MRGGKEREHARQAQSDIPDNEPRASGSAPAGSLASSGPSTTRALIAQPDISESSNTQITGPDVQSRFSARTPSEASSGGYQDVLDISKLGASYRPLHNGL